MQLADRDWLVYCSDCGEYTALNRFLPKRGHFQGEHSLLYNSFIMSDLLLGQFLLHHSHHPILAIPNRTADYTRVIGQQDRFMESLIDQMVSDRVQADQDVIAMQAAVRKEGYAALLALRRLLTEKARELEKEITEDPAQAKMRLGRVLGIEWCLAQIDHLLELGQFTT